MRAPTGSLQMSKLTYFAAAAVIFLFGYWTSAEAAKKPGCGSGYASCITNCNTYPRGPAGSPAANHFLQCLSRCDGSYNACIRSGGSPTARGPVGGNPPKRGPVSTPPSSSGTKHLPSAH
jgi:hypothetical protein